jgi:hypothetical protein
MSSAQRQAVTLFPKASKEMQVTVACPDGLGMFSFASGNVSDWLDKDDLEVSYSMNGEPVSAEDAAMQGVTDFAIRAAVCPSSHLSATISIGMVPTNKAGLTAQLGNNTVSTTVPHIALHINEKAPNPGSKVRSPGGTALLSRAETASEGCGMGVLPYCDVTAKGVEDADCPDGNAFKEASLRFLRASTVKPKATTAANWPSRMVDVAAGTAKPGKNPPHVFPMYSPAAASGPAATGERLLLQYGTLVDCA